MDSSTLVAKRLKRFFNKINFSNFLNIIPDVFDEDLAKNKAIFGRILMEALIKACEFNDSQLMELFALVLAHVNAEFPNAATFFIKALILKLKSLMDPEISCDAKQELELTALTKFLGNLVNHGVVYWRLALEVMSRLTRKPYDNVRVAAAVSLLVKCGPSLIDLCPEKLAGVVSGDFKSIQVLHGGQINDDTLGSVSRVINAHRASFEGYPPPISHGVQQLIPTEQTVIRISLLDEIRPGEKRLMERAQHTRLEWMKINEEEKKELWTNLVDLKGTIYWKLKSSQSPETAANQILRIRLNRESVELSDGYIGCVTDERYYDRFYAVVAHEICKQSKRHKDIFERSLMEHYNRLKHENGGVRHSIFVAFFTDLLARNAISWAVMSCIEMRAEEMTPSAEDFVVTLFKGLVERIGIEEVLRRMTDPSVYHSIRDSLHPRDNATFSTTFFDSIGLKSIPDAMD